MPKETFNPTEPWKIIAEHDEVDNQWLRVRNVTFQLPNGHTLEDYYIAERPSVVVIIPFQEGKTYLFQEYERGVNEVGHKFPGGRIDEGETPDTAAMREFQEELGLKPSELISLGTTYVDPGF